jgi:hypothetical protein
MKRVVVVAALGLALTAGVAVAGTPQVYLDKCRNCHGMPGKWWAKNYGPDLAKTKFTLEQFIRQVRYGSKWEGKPPLAFKYKTRVMPPQVGVEEDEIAAIYVWAKEQAE